MPLRVLIIQSETPVAAWLANFFTARGDQVTQVSSPGMAMARLAAIKPGLVVLDLHLPGSAWLELLHLLHKSYPQARIIITSKHPDVQRELQAQGYGVRVFVRQPLSQSWMNKALASLEGPSQMARGMEKTAITRSRVRVPVRAKITIPYTLLAVLVALVGAYLVSQVILQTVEDRFTSQLTKSGKQAADWMVLEENHLLETLRLVAGTTRISQAVQAQDVGTLRDLVLPLAVNAGQESIVILDVHGMGILSLHHVAAGNLEDYSAVKGEAGYDQLDFVHAVLSHQVDQGRDKFAGIMGDSFYICGGLHTADGSLVGVVLVGERLSLLVQRMSQEIIAEASLYDLGGQPLASTLFTLPENYYPLNSTQMGQVLSNQDQASLRRDLSVASSTYSEILAPWEVRGGQDLGLLGVSLAQTFMARANQITQVQIFLLVVSVLLLVILIGLLVANQITRPLLKVVDASSQVARGNLDVKVEPRGNDEVTVLARSFNTMVAGLQEGSIYRDLLGRTVSPEVREQLRQTFLSGSLHLEGQEAVATVLMTDIRGFTTLSEHVDPAEVFRWLNEYFGELVPIVTANGGVVNKFDGDAMLAFFGILPSMQNLQQSAYAACTTAVSILKAIEQVNTRRVGRGAPPLATGIGINSGPVTAGSLGASDRLHYTIIGDTVNAAQRLEALTRQILDASGVLVGQSTYQALGELSYKFHFQPLGVHPIKGKSDQMEVYRLLADEPSGSPGRSG